MIHCLFYCHVPLKEYSNHRMSLHDQTLYFFLMTEKVVFVSGFYGLLLFKKKEKKKKKDGCWRDFHRGFLKF